VRTARSVNADATFPPDAAARFGVTGIRRIRRFPEALKLLDEVR